MSNTEVAFYYMISSKGQTWKPNIIWIKYKSNTIQTICQRKSGLVSLLSSISRIDLSVTGESLSLRWGSDSSVSSGSHSNNSSVDGTRDTVVQFVVQLWQSVLGVDRCLWQISDSSSFNHVSDSDSLDGLILWNTSGTVQASDWLYVTSTFLVSTVGSSLFWHVELNR